MYYSMTSVRIHVAKPSNILLPPWTTACQFPCRYTTPTVSHIALLPSQYSLGGMIVCFQDHLALSVRNFSSGARAWAG
jgi:hypothetical protein